MARFFGRVGYIETRETRPGIWEETQVEYQYYGDVIRNSRRLESSGSTVIDSPVLNNSISIIADEYAYSHCSAIRYVEWMGSLWKVTNFEVQRPRLLLTIGGLWNGQKA